MSATLVFFDTETTGLDPAKDSIIELACVKVYDINQIEYESVFHRYVRTNNEIDEDSFRIHGISKEFLRDKPEFQEVYRDLLDFIGNSTIVAHNASFDMSFLNAELGRLGVGNLTNNVIDSLIVAKKMYPGSQVGIDALMKRFGMSARGYHSALEDAKILARIYSCMHAPKQDGLFNISNNNMNTTFNICRKIIT